MIFQEVDGEEHPILYFSWKLFPWEVAYSVIEKDSLAVKWALEAVCSYLWGSHSIS